MVRPTCAATNWLNSVMQYSQEGRQLIYSIQVREGSFPLAPLPPSIR